MATLSEVRDEIKKVLPVANQDASSGPYETMTGRRGQKRNAEEKLKSLKQQYSEALMRSAVFIVTTGSGVEDFAALASTEGNCFSADSEKFFSDIAATINPALYQRESLVNLFSVIGRALENKALELNVLGYPQLIYKEKYARNVKNREELMPILKQALTEQVGGEMVGIQTIYDLVDKAIAKNHGALVTPIVLKTSDESLALQLVPALERLTSKVFFVSVGESSSAAKSVDGAIVLEEANESNLKKALKIIKSTLKK